MVEAAAYGGVLERLRALAKWFAESCDWSQAGMTQDILAGVVDEPPQIRVTRRSQATLTRRLKFETDRLLLDVHPTVAAEQVREVYRDARESMRPSRVRVAKRPRTAIVEFVNRERRTRPSASGWRGYGESHSEQSYGAAFGSCDHSSRGVCPKNRQTTV